MPFPQLTPHHLRLAAEAARHWPATVSGAMHICHVNRRPPDPKDEALWECWFCGYPNGVPVPVEVPG